MSAAYWANFTLQSYNCFYAILVWDLLLHLRQEKQRIWDREWSAAKGIYLFNRWYGLAALTMNLCFYNINVAPAECKKYVRAEPASSILIVLSYQSILLVRCYAVWARKTFILLIGLGMLAAQLVVQAYATSQMFPTPLPTPVGPCVVNGKKSLIASYFLFPACVDTIVTLLTFARVLYLTRTTRSRVIVTFMKEGFAFFMIVFIANVLNGILYLQNNTDVSTVGSGFAIIMGNVCGNHLILRSRRKADPSASSLVGSSNSRPTHHHPAISGRPPVNPSRVDVELATMDAHPTAYDVKSSDLSHSGVLIQKNTETW